jgi:hypothetical protein
MAHFYASITGQTCTEVTRCGTKNSGISGHIRGWDCGVGVYGYVNDNGQDSFDVYVTSGSSTRNAMRYIGTFTAKDLKAKNIE